MTDTEPLAYRGAAPLLAPITGREPTRTSYSRWIRIGRPVADGKTAKLRATRCGKRWTTCKKWVEEFVKDVTTAHLDRAG